MRRSLLIGAGALCFESARLTLGAALAGCSAPTTGGERVRITTRVRSDLSATPTLVNAFGWRIDVTTAWLALERLYYVTGPAIGLAGDPRQTCGIAAAWAHPGHYDAGEVLAESLQPVAVDLLAKETRLGASDGVTGVVRSAVVAFGELPDHPGVAALLEGVARRDDQQVGFFARLERAAIVNPTSGLPEIEGCPLTGGAIEGDGDILLRVETAVWVDQIDFAELAAHPDAERVELEPDTPPHNAFRRGLGKAIAYRFGYSSLKYDGDE